MHLRKSQGMTDGFDLVFSRMDGVTSRLRSLTVVMSGRHCQKPLSLVVSCGLPDSQSLCFGALLSSSETRD